MTKIRRRQLVNSLIMAHPQVWVDRPILFMERQGTNGVEYAALYENVALDGDRIVMYRLADLSEVLAFQNGEFPEEVTGEFVDFRKLASEGWIPSL